MTLVMLTKSHWPDKDLFKILHESGKKKKNQINYAKKKIKH